MRETPRAKVAFNDYLAMGPGRSLEKLLAGYRKRAETWGRLGVPTLHATTLEAWSVAHLWQQRLAEAAEAERAAIVARGIAERQNRVDAYQDRWLRMRQVIKARSVDPELADVPGGATGLLVRTFKGVAGSIAEEFAVDTGLLKELRELEKQAAEDLGQWVAKQEQSGSVGLTIEYVNDWRGKADPAAIPPPGPDGGPSGG